MKATSAIDTSEYSDISFKQMALQMAFIAFSQPCFSQQSTLGGNYIIIKTTQKPSIRKCQERTGQSVTTTSEKF